jgi:hypothetical protein
MTAFRSLLLLFAFTFSLTGHSQVFKKRDAIAGFAIGFPHMNKLVVQSKIHDEKFKEGFNGDVTIVSIKGVNPLIVKWEYAITSAFALGFSFAWYSIELKVKDTYNRPQNGSGTIQVTDLYTYKLRSGALGVRGNYHFPIKIQKSDLFAGLALGFVKNSLAIDVTRTTNTTEHGFADLKLPGSFYVAPTVGYRYYPGDNFGLTAEVGYERGAFLQLGLAYRFRPYVYQQLH